MLIQAEAIQTVFDEYVERHGLEEISEIFRQGSQIEVGRHAAVGSYAERLQACPTGLEESLQVNPADSDPVRASCVEFVLAGLYAKT